MADATLDVEILLHSQTRNLTKSLKQTKAQAKGMGVEIQKLTQVGSGFDISGIERAQTQINGVTRSVMVLKNGIGVLGQTQQANLQKGVMNSIKSISALGKALIQSDQLFGKNSKQSQVLTQQLNQLGMSAKRARQQFATFDFGFLSLIFGGMALQRTFGRVFTSIKDGYLEAVDANNQYKKTVTNLGESFQFLKFSFGQAFFESEVVQNIIESLSDSLIRLGEWANDYPDTAATLVGVAGGLAALGTAAFALGTAKQLFDTGGTIAVATKSLKNLGKVKGLWGVAGGVNAVALSLIALGLATADSETGAKIVRDGLDDLNDSIGSLLETIGNLFDKNIEVNDSWETLGQIGGIVFRGLIDGARFLLAILETVIWATNNIIESLKDVIDLGNNMVEGWQESGTRGLFDAFREYRDEQKERDKELKNIWSGFWDGTADYKEYTPERERLESTELSVKELTTAFGDQATAEEILNDTSTDMDILYRQLAEETIPSKIEKLYEEKEAVDALRRAHERLNETERDTPSIDYLNPQFGSSNMISTLRD